MKNAFKIGSLLFDGIGPIKDSNVTHENKMCWRAVCGGVTKNEHEQPRVHPVGLRWECVVGSVALIAQFTSRLLVLAMDGALCMC